MSNNIIKKVVNKRNLFKLLFIILYVFLIILLYNLGKGHTINIVNQKFISKDGVEIPARYTCKIINVLPQSPLLELIDKISISLFNKKILKDNIITYFVGVPGQIVVPWHTKKVRFEFYDGKTLVKTIKKEIKLDKNTPQYLWNLAALYEDHPEWQSVYIIEELVTEEENINTE